MLALNGMALDHACSSVPSLVDLTLLQETWHLQHSINIKGQYPSTNIATKMQQMLHLINEILCRRSHRHHGTYRPTVLWEPSVGDSEPV